MEIIFWLAFVGVVYAYFGYAILLAIVAKLRQWPIAYSEKETDDQPSITILIPAYNEELVIANKLDNNI